MQAQLRAPTPPPRGLCPRSSAQDIVFHHLSHSPLLTAGYRFNVWSPSCSPGELVCPLCIDLCCQWFLSLFAFVLFSALRFLEGCHHFLFLFKAKLKNTVLSFGQWIIAAVSTYNTWRKLSVNISIHLPRVSSIFSWRQNLNWIGSAPQTVDIWIGIGTRGRGIYWIQRNSMQVKNFGKWRSFHPSIYLTSRLLHLFKKKYSFTNSNSRNELEFKRNFQLKYEWSTILVFSVNLHVQCSLKKNSSLLKSKGPFTPRITIMTKI